MLSACPLGNGGGRPRLAGAVSEACSPTGHFKDWGSQDLHQELCGQVVTVGNHRAGAGC